MIDKVILLIDMDGVVYNWYGHLLRVYRARYPDRVYVKPEDVTKFYVEELYPEEHRQDVMAIAREQGFYLGLDPMPGAIEALKDIEENCQNFIEPFICTSPEVEFEGLMCHSEKVQSVKRDLGDWWVKRTIITKDKTLVRGSFLIDDKPEIKGVLQPVWAQIPFDQPYAVRPEPGNPKPMFNWSLWPLLKNDLRSNFPELEA
jgi:5'-nucleotidase